MNVATRRGATERENLPVVRLDVAHLRLGNLAVVQRRAPVGRALKDSQVTDCLGEFLDCLHGGRPGANDSNALASKVDAIPGPCMRVAGSALEGVDTRNVRHRRCRQYPDGTYQKAGGVTAAIIQRELPAAKALVPARRGKAAVELNITPQVELVGNIVEIALGLGLGSKPLAPVPFMEELLRKRIAIGMAFGIEASAWIAVPIPGSTNCRTRFECQHPQAEFA